MYNIYKCISIHGKRVKFTPGRPLLPWISKNIQRNLINLRNLIQSNWNQIVFTIYRLIWSQMDNLRLVPNQSVHGNYNMILVWFKKISKRFFFMYVFFINLQSSIHNISIYIYVCYEIVSADSVDGSALQRFQVLWVRARPSTAVWYNL